MNITTAIKILKSNVIVPSSSNVKCVNVETPGYLVFEIDVMARPARYEAAHTRRYTLIRNYVHGSKLYDVKWTRA